MNSEEHVILVDTADNPVGTMEKMEAHRRGLLHRAFSVFLFTDRNELLLQQRAPGKYHSPGLWTNACCSHPRPGESTGAAAARRLAEEMGLHTPLTHGFSFVYEAEFGNGLTEHEFDHVFFGKENAAPQPAPEEVQAWKRADIDTLRAALLAHPEEYTVWFRIVFERAVEFYRSQS